MLTQARLKQRLTYDPATGVFTARESVKQVPAGAVVGSATSKGYRRIKIDDQEYSAHRLAWLYVYGEFPPGDIDHINRVRNDNRICNLRVATRQENGQNRSRGVNNTSGHLGVTLIRARNKWRAAIKVAGELIYLGLYPTPEQAAAAYASAKAQLHTFSPTP